MRRSHPERAVERLATSKVENFLKVFNLACAVLYSCVFFNEVSTGAHTFSEDKIESALGGGVGFTHFLILS